jgi:hypothetical protein
MALAEAKERREREAAEAKTLHGMRRKRVSPVIEKRSKKKWAGGDAFVTNPV